MAILSKAFRGELVPTEAELARREGREYEPAGVLLERVRAERGDGGAAQRDSVAGRRAWRRGDPRRKRQWVQRSSESTARRAHAAPRPWRRNGSPSHSSVIYPGYSPGSVAVAARASGLVPRSD